MVHNLDRLKNYSWFRMLQLICWWVPLDISFGFLLYIVIWWIPKPNLKCWLSPIKSFRVWAQGMLKTILHYKCLLDG